MIQTQNNSNPAWSTRAWITLAVFNGMSVLISGYFGFVALTNPTAQPWIAGPTSTDLVTYASLFGIRSVLITIAVLVLFGRAPRLMKTCVTYLPSSVNT